MEIERPKFKFQLCHLIVVKSWLSHVTSQPQWLCLVGRKDEMNQVYRICSAYIVTLIIMLCYRTCAKVCVRSQRNTEEDGKRIRDTRFERKSDL